MLSNKQLALSFNGFVLLLARPMGCPSSIAVEASLLLPLQPQLPNGKQHLLLLLLMLRPCC
jgi:hypothetical protein